MYLIEKLWIDVLENRDAYGFETIGYVESIDEARRICSLKYIKKEDYLWPLEYACEFKGSTIPVFRYKTLKCLDNKEVDEL